MFNLSENNLIINEFYKILENKYLLLKKDAGIVDIKKHSKLVAEQIELRGFLDKEYNDQSKFLFPQLLKQFSAQSNEDIKTDKIQKELLQQFLENDLKTLLDECKLLKNILLSESEALKIGKSDEYTNLLNQEKEQLDKFRNIITKDGELEKKFAGAYRSAKHMDYNETIAKLKHGISKLMAKYKIESPIGVENIPLSGPVIIAPRHYEAGIDSATLYAAIPRRTFVLAGVDWVQTGTQNFASKMLYTGLGAIKVNRQARPDSDAKVASSPYYTAGASTGEAIRQIVFLLQSGESIIIFPEGWANEGRTQGTIIKSNGVLPAQDGFMLATELAQRGSKQKISIIPTGLILDENKKTIRAVFGKPMYYENVNSKDMSKYRKAFGEELMSEIKKLSNL